MDFFILCFVAAMLLIVVNAVANLRTVEKNNKVMFEVDEKLFGPVMKEAGFTTHRELINEGLTLLRWAVIEAKGRDIGSAVDGKDFQKVYLPLFRYKD